MPFLEKSCGHLGFGGLFNIWYHKNDAGYIVLIPRCISRVQCSVDQTYTFSLHIFNTQLDNQNVNLAEKTASFLDVVVILNFGSILSMHGTLYSYHACSWDLFQNVSPPPHLLDHATKPFIELPFLSFWSGFIACTCTWIFSKLSEH